MNKIEIKALSADEKIEMAEQGYGLDQLVNDEACSVREAVA